MKRVNYANALIIDKLSHKVLLVKNGDPNSHYWSFPGGKVEDSETLEQAVVREVKEETGFGIRIESLYSVREVLFEDKNEHALIFTFISEIVAGEIDISDPDQEIIEVQWMDIDVANKLMPYIPNQISIPEEQEISSAFYFFHGKNKVEKQVRSLHGEH